MQSVLRKVYSSDSPPLQACKPHPDKGKPPAKRPREGVGGRSSAAAITCEAKAKIGHSLAWVRIGRIPDLAFRFGNSPRATGLTWRRAIRISVQLLRRVEPGRCGCVSRLAAELCGRLPG